MAGHVAKTMPRQTVIPRAIESCKPVRPSGAARRRLDGELIRFATLTASRVGGTTLPGGPNGRSAHTTFEKWSTRGGRAGKSGGCRWESKVCRRGPYLPLSVRTVGQQALLRRIAQKGGISGLIGLTRTGGGPRIGRGGASARARPQHRPPRR